MLKFLKGLFAGAESDIRKQETTLAQQAENWKTFNRHVEDGVCIIQVNTAIQDSESTTPKDWVGLEFNFKKRQIDASGFPELHVLKKCFGLENQILASIHAIGGNIAASKTGMASRIVWYCAPAGALQGLMQEQLKDFDSVTSRILQGTFGDYIQLLPNDFEKQLSENAEVLRTLSDNGDDGSEPREVLHWANGAPENLQKLAERLEVAGYVISDFQTEQLRFARLSVLNREQAERETQKLIEICQQFDCEYDGWETPIVRPVLH